MSMPTVLTGGFSVVPEDLRATASTFARLCDRLSDASTEASGGLSGTSGMAGDDAVMARWRVRYDPMAAALWGAIGASGCTLASIADKLTATGDAYLAADHAATPNASGPPDRLPAAGASARTAPPPPSSTGPDGLPDVLAEFFPGGDPELLRVASRAWTSLAATLEDVGFGGDGAFRGLLGANSGAGFSTMRTYWERLFSPCGTDELFNAVAIGARRLGLSCAGLADLIDRTRAAVLGAAGEAVDDMSPLDLPAQLLGRFTVGITELELLVGTGALALSYLQGYRDAYLRELDHLADQLQPAEQTLLERLGAVPASQDPVGVGLADVSEVLGVGLRGSAWDGLGANGLTPDQIHLTPKAVTHILDGDGDGSGGHLSGSGRPGKSEFPPDWGRDKILTEALGLSRDPGTVVRTRDDDGWLIQGTRDGVKVRVIVADDGSLVTAIPLKGPGVIQNRR